MNGVVQHKAGSRLSPRLCQGTVQADHGCLGSGCHAFPASEPYRHMGHPGCVGTTLFELVTPIILGWLWAPVSDGLGALLVVLRTALEDSMLPHELDRYGAYARQVRSRLLPDVR